MQDCIEAYIEVSPNFCCYSTRNFYSDGVDPNSIYVAVHNRSLFAFCVLYCFIYLMELLMGATSYICGAKMLILNVKFRGIKMCIQQSEKRAASMLLAINELLKAMSRVGFYFFFCERLENCIFYVIFLCNARFSGRIRIVYIVHADICLYILSQENDNKCYFLADPYLIL